MSSRRLQSPLYHSVPKPPSRPPPLWQVAAALDPGSGGHMTSPQTTDTHAPATPMTSAVLAGWICVGVGLLTAWFFPLANVFFSIAIILSIVAMATHQVRSGLLLLAGSLTSIVVCVVVFIFFVTAAVVGAVHAAAKARPELRPAAGWPVATTPAPRLPLTGNAAGTGQRPVSVDEVTAMLADGRRDDEIMAALAGRPLLNQFGSPEVTRLRVYGASERLLDYLRGRQAYQSPTTSVGYTAPLASNSSQTATASAPFFPKAQPQAITPSTPVPLDHAARDRQIQSLQTAINSLDDQISRYRTTPHSTYNQQSGDAYLDTLDKQRTELRRQKWALEGR